MKDQIRVEILHYKSIDKGALSGAFTLHILPWGLKIYKCKHFTHEGGCWFKYPEEEIKHEGKKSDYFPYVVFGQGPLAETIKDLTIQALRGQNAQLSSSQRSTNQVPSEAPFDFGETPF